MPDPRRTTIFSLGLRLGPAIAGCLPHWSTDLAALPLGRLLCWLSPGRRNAVRANLRHALPRAPARVIDRLTRRTFVNFTRCLMDLARLSTMNPARLRSMVAPDRPDPLARALVMQRGALVLTLHLGNWDLAGAYLAARGLPVSALVEPTPAHLLAFFTRQREATGMRTYTLDQTPLALLETVRRNRILAVLADRDVLGNGKPVRFFDGLRRIPARLADFIVRARIPVVFGYLVLTGAGPRRRYRMVIHEPATFRRAGDFEEFMLRRYEEAIRRYPDQWFAFRPDWMENAA